MPEVRRERIAAAESRIKGHGPRLLQVRIRSGVAEEMIVTLAEHSVDESLLPEEPIVLDVGCRWFTFAEEMRRIRPKARIICLDPDKDVLKDAKAKSYEIYINALVGQELPGEMPYGRYQSGVSNFIRGLACQFYEDQCEAWQGEIVSVSALSIMTLMGHLEIGHFDVVKLDCECSEFSILESWPGRIATQISVEFHDWADRKKWDDAYFCRLFAGPLKDYDVVQHDEHGCYAHADSLLVLK